KSARWGARRRKWRRLPANSRRSPFLDASRRRQLDRRTQAAGRGAVEAELALVEGHQVGDDRKTEPRAGLALVEPATAAGRLDPLLGRKARTVVVDIDRQPAGGIVVWRLLVADADPHLALRPFAGVVDELA